MVNLPLLEETWVMMFSLVDSLYCLWFELSVKVRLFFLISNLNVYYVTVLYKVIGQLANKFSCKCLFLFYVRLYIWNCETLSVKEKKTLFGKHTSIALERQNCISLTSGWNFIITVWSARVGNTQPLEWLWVSVFVLEDSYTEENPITQHVYKQCTAFTCAGLVDEASGS